MPLNFAGIQVPKEIQPSIKSPQSPKLLTYNLEYFSCDYKRLFDKLSRR